MIENISTLFANSKIVNSIRRRKNIIDISPSQTSLEEAKARVQQIIDEGASKRRKKKQASSKANNS